MFVASSLLNSRVLHSSKVVWLGENLGERNANMIMIMGIEAARIIIVNHFLSIFY